MTTAALSNATMQRESSSPDNTTVGWRSEDLTTTSPTGNGTAILLNQSDKTNDLFHYVTMYFNMVGIPVGLIFNLLCIAVFMKSKLARTSIALEMIVLSVADNIKMISYFIFNSVQWSNFIDIPDLSAINHVTCAGLFYFGLVGSLLYSWTLSMATIERFCCINFPLKVKTWNLYKKSQVLLPVLVFISLGLPMYHFWCYNLLVINDEGGKMCLTSPKVPSKMCSVSQAIVAIGMVSFIPGVLIFVLSILIGVMLYRSKVRRQEIGVNSNNNNSNDNREFRITTMLLTEAIFFLVTRGTMSTMLQLNRRHHYSKPFLIYPLKVFVCLVTLNNSTNFAFYMIFLQDFRRTFTRMMIMTATKMSNCFKCLFTWTKSSNSDDLALSVAKHTDGDGNGRESDVCVTDKAVKTIDADMEALNETLDAEDNRYTGTKDVAVDTITGIYTGWHYRSSNRKSDPSSRHTREWVLDLLNDRIAGQEPGCMFVQNSGMLIKVYWMLHESSLKTAIIQFCMQVEYVVLLVGSVTWLGS